MYSKAGSHTDTIIRPTRVPRLLPLSPGVLPRWSQGEGRVFRVLSGGSAAGIELLRGDLLLVRGDTGRGQVGVLVPRGYGRPMMGVRTTSGLRAEPGGMSCSLERWVMAGRLVARARSFRTHPRSGQVLRQQGGVAEYPAELSGVRGRWVALELAGPLTPELHGWLSRRMTGLRRSAATRVVGECAWLHEGCPLLRAGALIAELREHFGLRASVGVAALADAAVAAVQLAMPSAVLAVEAGAEAEFLAPLPVAPAAQLTLFPAAA